MTSLYMFFKGEDYLVSALIIEALFGCFETPK
jgi:hypothetical protein